MKIIGDFLDLKANFLN